MDRTPLTPASPFDEIEEYFEETHKEAEEAGKERRLQGELNWSFYLNRQDAKIKDGAVGSMWGHERYPYRTENLIRGNLDTQVGRQVKDLPDAEALPTTADAVARGAAKIAQDLIEYWAFEHDLDREFTRVCLWGWLSGHAGFKPTFDVAYDCVRFEAVKAWEFCSDPDTDSVENGRWVTFIDHKSQFDALEMVRSRMPPEEFEKLSTEDFEVSEYKPGVTAKMRKGVKVEERWEVPHPRCPEGFYALLVGGKLVEAKPYPYMLPSREGRMEADPETGAMMPAKSAYLPIVVWSPGENDDGPYGSTPVDDAVERQRLHNENISHVANLMRISADLRRYGNKEVLDRIQTGKNQNVECADPSQIPRWDEPPRISPALMQAKEEGREEVARLLGVDQQQGNSSNQPARAIAYVEQIDSYKLTLPHRSFMAMVGALYEMGLKLAQVFLSDQKVYSMPHGDSVREIAFRGADLHGVTVRIEPRAGKDKYAAQKAQSLAERAEAGLADPQQAALALETGQPKPSSAATAERLALADLEEVMAGMPPSLEADPQIAVPTLREAAEVLLGNGDAEGAEAARQLAAMYARKIQEQGPPPEAGQQQRVQAPQADRTPTQDILPGGPPVR